MNTWKKSCHALSLLVLAATLIFFSGCEVNVGKPTASASPATPSINSPAPANSPEQMQTPTSASASKLPQIDCSTARIPITEAIYELFTDTYGHTGPEPLCSKTHGAWLNLADGKADILFLVAPTEDELSYFAERDVDIEMKVYGYDGLVFIGNESNPVQNLTTRQIRDIYSGKIDNWMHVGGENADIAVYIRNKESGSQRLFESLVWDGYDMPNFSSMNFSEDEINPAVTQRETVMYEMGEITESVLLNQYSIGFNIMSYIDNAFKNSTLKLFSVNGYMPTTENFVSGGYPYLTTSYVAIRADEAAGSPARKLYDWVGSEESRALISKNSTLTVAFSDSIVIKAGMALPSQAGGGETQDDLSDMILSLNRKTIRQEDLLPYTLEELGYLRNGIFALSGKIFATEKYIQFFNAQSWYQGTVSSDSEVAGRFNDYQKENLEIILAYEKKLQ